MSFNPQSVSFLLIFFLAFTSNSPRDESVRLANLKSADGRIRCGEPLPSNILVFLLTFSLAFTSSPPTDGFAVANFLLPPSSFPSEKVSAIFRALMPKRNSKSGSPPKFETILWQAA